MNLLLEGVKVIEVSTMAAVPMAARLLGDWGADVIKIENPKTGDPWRTWVKTPKGDVLPPKLNAYYWDNYNRNKKSVALEVKEQKGREILFKMIEKADVFLTNMRPFEISRYHLDYSTLSRLNKRLIYGSFTGFGREGPDKDKPGHDTVGFWSRSGFIYQLQQGDAPPPAPGFRTVAAGDKLTAMFLACGVILALRDRDRTGEGQEVDVSLLHTGIYALCNVAMSLGPIDEVFGQDDVVTRKEREEVSPLMINYKTADKRWLQLSLVPVETYWSRFCKAISYPELEHDPRFATTEARVDNFNLLREIIEEVIKKKPLAEWKIIFNAANLNWSPIMKPREVTQDPQARASGVFTGYDHPVFGKIEGIANPIKMSKTPSSIRQPGPEFGQHTEEVLLEYGLSWDDIQRLKTEGLIN